MSTEICGVSAPPLTECQRDVIRYIVEHIERTGRHPTYRQIIVEFGLKSPNSATQKIAALGRKGYIEFNDDESNCVGSYTLARDHEGRRVTGFCVLVEGER